jgi:hypothetical protein
MVHAKGPGQTSFFRDRRPGHRHRCCPGILSLGASWCYTWPMRSYWELVHEDSSHNQRPMSRATAMHVRTPAGQIGCIVVWSGHTGAARGLADWFVFYRTNDLPKGARAANGQKGPVLPAWSGGTVRKQATVVLSWTPGRALGDFSIHSRRSVRLSAEYLVFLWVF